MILYGIKDIDVLLLFITLYKSSQTSCYEGVVRPEKISLDFRINVPPVTKGLVKCFNTDK